MQNKRCFNCIRYRGALKCQAFPNGIPEKILIGEDNHSKPLKDQKNDIVFEPIDKKNL
jgi:hypothetical protein